MAQQLHHRYLQPPLQQLSSKVLQRQHTTKTGISKLHITIIIRMREVVALHILMDLLQPLQERKMAAAALPPLEHISNIIMIRNNSSQLHSSTKPHHLEEVAEEEGEVTALRITTYRLVNNVLQLHQQPLLPFLQ